MQPLPEKILRQAYKYICGEDILLSLEYNELSPRHPKVLLKPRTPLTDVFQKWGSYEDSHSTENIWNAVEARATSVARADLIR